MSEADLARLRAFVLHLDDPVSAARAYLADKLRQYEEPMVCLAPDESLRGTAVSPVSPLP